jgi:hypothetical protein
MVATFHHGQSSDRFTTCSHGWAEPANNIDLLSTCPFAEGRLVEPGAGEHLNIRAGLAKRSARTAIERDLSALKGASTNHTSRCRSSPGGSRLFGGGAARGSSGFPMRSRPLQPCGGPAPPSTAVVPVLDRATPVVPPRRLKTGTERDRVP